MQVERPVLSSDPIMRPNSQKCQTSICVWCKPPTASDSDIVLNMLYETNSAVHRLPQYTTIKRRNFEVILQIRWLLTVMVFSVNQGWSAPAPISTKSKVGHESGHSKFVSPDRKLIAVVVPTGNKKNESRIQIVTTAGASTLKTDFGSKDGEHGKCFCRGAWTSDSKFFVWSMESS